MANSADPADLFYVNGILGATGDYGWAPLTAKDFAQWLQGDGTSRVLEALRTDSNHRQNKSSNESADPLSRAGWCVLFANGTSSATREALRPLLRLRRRQAGDGFRILEGDSGYHAGESAKDFLARTQKDGSPEAPFFLLIVGGPGAIPLNFQRGLAKHLAVGRIHFEAAEDYGRYSQLVVDAEEGRLSPRTGAAFFAPEHADDPVTASNVRHLITPLIDHLQRRHPEWHVESHLQGAATKEKLARLLAGSETPALLLTAGHGMTFAEEDPRQRPHQGALLCQDWPGPQAWQQPILRDFYFAGEDLNHDADLAGLISIHLSGFGLGKPLAEETSEDLLPQLLHGQSIVSPSGSFLAALPQNLLLRGALAVVGPAGHTWSHTSIGDASGSAESLFGRALSRLISGASVGSAVTAFKRAHIEQALSLADRMENNNDEKKIYQADTVRLWAILSELESTIVLGDPAVRLPKSTAHRGQRLEPAFDLAFNPQVGTGSKEETSDPGHPAKESEKDPPPSRISPAREEVFFSAYHPDTATVGVKHPLLVYAHLQGMLEALTTDAGQILGMVAADYHDATIESNTRIAPGTEIVIVPHAGGVIFEPPMASLVWSGPWQRADFMMQAQPDSADYEIDGAISCYLGPLLIADIPLPVKVVGPVTEGDSTSTGRSVHSTPMYETIFASYSHQDTAIVEAIECACQTLGLNYLRDVMTLKSGQKWSEELLLMIERADVFQLFWSEESSRSPFVEQEWRHALHLADLKSPNFIRPIYWQKPLPPVPPPLYHIHFSLVAPPQPLNTVVLSPSGSTAPAMASDTLPLPSNQAAQVPAAHDLDSLDALTVSTFTAADPSAPESATLKARTRISLNGDIESFLPENSSETATLAVHEKAVAAALQARLAYLELLAARKPR